MGATRHQNAAMTRAVTWVAFGAVALGGGVAGSLLTLKLAPSASELAVESGVGLTTSKAAPADSGKSVDLDELRARLSSLDRRVSLLTFAKGPALPKSHGAEPGTADAGAQAQRSVDDPVFEAAVRDVLDQVEYERQAERDARRAEWRDEWPKRWTTPLVERLGLSTAQVDGMQAIAREHMGAVRALRESEDQGKPLLRSEWRTRVQSLSDQADKKLSELLDAAQKSKYDALDEADKLGGRGFWGRGDR
jgi:hypothetical protein